MAYCQLSGLGGKKTKRWQLEGKLRVYLIRRCVDQGVISVGLWGLEFDKHAVNGRTLK